MRSTSSVSSAQPGQNVLGHPIGMNFISAEPAANIAAGNLANGNADPHYRRTRACPGVRILFLILAFEPTRFNVVVPECLLASLEIQACQTTVRCRCGNGLSWDRI